MFSKIRVNALKYKTKELPSKATGNFCLPALTAGIENQGLNNYVPYDDATVLKNVISISANGANTGATFYQSNEFTVLQDAYAIQWDYGDRSLTDNQYLFITSCIAKTVYGNYEWTNKAGWEKIKNNIIMLPESDSGSIDFDFMESFVAELEAQRVAELEAYLSVTGLKDTHLSLEEEQALLNFNKITFDEYKLTDVFDIKNAGNILSKDIVENSGKTPYLCASSENNAVSSYISYKDELKTKGNCIFIGGKTFVVTYQESDFFSNDSHNLALYLKEAEYQNKYTQMYLAACVYKSLNHKYTWGNSISNKKAQKDYISLPTKDGKIDFNSMSTLISAIHKLVIKDVVRYADEKIEKTKEAINSNTN